MKTNFAIYFKSLDTLEKAPKPVVTEASLLQLDKANEERVMQMIKAEAQAVKNDIEAYKCEVQAINQHKVVFSKTLLTQDVTKINCPYLCGVTQELARQMGVEVTCIRLNLDDEDGFSAKAAVKHLHIGYQKLLELDTYNQLLMLLAHEMTHIKNGDIDDYYTPKIANAAILTMVTAPIVLLCNKDLVYAGFSCGVALSAASLAVATYLDHKREYAADKGAYSLL